jgi:hypothetical protein
MFKNLLVSFQKNPNIAICAAIVTLLVIGGPLWFLSNESNKQERINSVNRAVQAENSRKANEAHKGLTGPLPGKIFDFPSDKKK